MRQERRTQSIDRIAVSSLCLDNCLPSPLTVDVSGKTWHPGRLWCEGLWECMSICGGVPSLSRGRRAVGKLQCRQSLLVNEDRSTVSGLLLWYKGTCHVCTESLDLTAMSLTDLLPPGLSIPDAIHLFYQAVGDTFAVNLAAGECALPDVRHGTDRWCSGAASTWIAYDICLTFAEEVRL